MTNVACDGVGVGVANVACDGVGVVGSGWRTWLVMVLGWWGRGGERGL